MGESFRCPLCGASEELASLGSHVATAHMDPRRDRWNCGACDYDGATRDAVAAHCFRSGHDPRAVRRDWDQIFLASLADFCASLDLRSSTDARPIHTPLGAKRPKTDADADVSRCSSLTERPPSCEDSPRSADASPMGKLEKADTSAMPSDFSELVGQVIHPTPEELTAGELAALFPPDYSSVCPFCEDPEFLGQAGLRRHLNQRHSVKMSEKGQAYLSGRDPVPELENMAGVSIVQAAINATDAPAALQFKDGEISCSICTDVFRGIGSLKSHLFQKHGVRTKSHFCHTCSLPFENKQAYHRHSRAAGHVTQRKSRIVCNICRSRFNYMWHLIRHLNAEHELPLEIQSAAFASPAEFEGWVMEEQRRNGFWLWGKGNPTQLKNGGVSITFICKSSSSYRNRHIRRRASDEDFSFSCSAHISGKRSEDGRVEVDFCFSHIGHDVTQSPEP